MIRILILIGFTFIFMHLHATGDISKYINMKYSWISFCTIFVLWFLTIAELIFYMIGPKNMMMIVAVDASIISKMANGNEEYGTQFIFYQYSRSYFYLSQPLILILLKLKGFIFLFMTKGPLFFSSIFTA